MSNYKLETLCVQGGYKPENGQARTLPIYQSTTYKYDSADHLGDLFDLKVGGHMYSRISNPTLECVEAKISEMEGGINANQPLSHVKLAQNAPSTVAIPLPPLPFIVTGKICPTTTKTMAKYFIKSATNTCVLSNT